MAKTTARRSFALLPLLLSLAIGGLATPAVAQSTFDVLHAFDSPPRQPYGELVRGSDGAFYGTTYSGGAWNVGVVFKVGADGSGFTKLHDFDWTEGAYPYSGLVVGSDGALYGTTPYGGAQGQGVLFRIAEDGSSFTRLYDFNYATGAYPFATLLAGPGGVLYGTASGGGPSGGGVAFQIGEDGSGFASLHNFAYSDGASPQAGLARGMDGALYGTTAAGGATGQGVVFRVTDDGTSFTNLHEFDGVGGAYPYQTGLVLGADGLYGTTNQGGAFGAGVVFRISEDGSAFASIHEFQDATGSYPFGGLIVGSDTFLYGTTSRGGPSGYGVVFKIAQNGAGFASIRDFDYYTTGGFAQSALVKGEGTALFGVTLSGGGAGNGVVFTLKEDGTQFSALHVFGASYGAQPVAGLTRGDDGALYGTTASGGAANAGIIYKLAEDGSGFGIVHEFDGPNGANPYAGLTRGSDGSFYGVTYAGGAGYGIVFKIHPDGSGFQKLREFAGEDGANPNGDLLPGVDGLYGTTNAGGLQGQGVIFRIREDGSAFSKLHEFDYANGAGPLAGLAEGGDGALYGVTAQGGANGQGTVFRIRPDGTAFQKLHDFDYYASGAFPQGALARGSGDALYGVASGGGAQAWGVFFRITEAGEFSKLRDFDQPRGIFPQSLIRGSDGFFYGVATGGGATGAGVVFKISEDGSYFARLHSFDGDTAGAPKGTLVEGSDGALYGTTQFGGPSVGGVVFRLVPGPDSDGDGWLDASDNCPSAANPDQLDSDFDGTGNACDSDDDNDGFLDESDNCPVNNNPDQSNLYGGPAGDVCEDTDGDTYLDAFDNCPVVVNPDQRDTDYDGRGDVCDAPSLSISSVSINEEMSGFVNAGFIVSLFPASSTPVTVRYQTTPGTATPGSDYVAIPPTTLTFSPGQTAKAISVRIRGDARDEEDETYYVDLSSPVGAELLIPRGVGTILDDDSPPTLSVNDPTVVEGSSQHNMRFTVTLSAVSGKTVTVAYTTQNGTADAPADYTPQSGQVTFDPGQTSRVVTVPIVGDLLHEADETVLLLLFGPVNASIADGEGMGTIQDDDPDPTSIQVSIDDVSVVEGASGTVPAIFTVSLSQAPSQTVKVGYGTAGGTAAAPGDFGAKTGTLIFAPGQISKTISVAVKGDANEEPDETFVVNLSDPQGLTILDGQGIGTIVNDDGPPLISVADKAVTEGDAGTQGMAVTVSLSGTTSNTVTVNYATADAGVGTGFAKPGSDYVSKAGLLTFEPGQKTKNITIVVKGDLASEGTEGFFLNLAGPTNATLGDGQAVLTILDNEP